MCVQESVMASEGSGINHWCNAENSRGELKITSSPHNTHRLPHYNFATPHYLLPYIYTVYLNLHKNAHTEPIFPPIVGTNRSRREESTAFMQIHLNLKVEYQRPPPPTPPIILPHYYCHLLITACSHTKECNGPANAEDIL